MGRTFKKINLAVISVKVKLNQRYCLTYDATKWGHVSANFFDSEGQPSTKTQTLVI